MATKCFKIKEYLKSGINIPSVWLTSIKLNSGRNTFYRCSVRREKEKSQPILHTEKILTITEQLSTHFATSSSMRECCLKGSMSIFLRVNTS